MRELRPRRLKGAACAVVLGAIVGCGAPSSEQGQYLTIDHEAADAIRKAFPESAEVLEVNRETSMLRVDEDAFDGIGHLMHEEFKRCGGFFSFGSEGDLREWGEASTTQTLQMDRTYTMDQPELVEALLAEVGPENILATIRKLSSYKNRYYTSATGSASQDWLANKWQELGESYGGFSVEQYQHPDWPQPSVVATIEGSTHPEEIIVIGGHGDSVAGWFDRQNAHAPGADDNASGIAVITEALRIIVASDWRPKRTLKFMSYAAEEVGLKGSREIARQHAAEGKEVIAAMQLDMTGHIGPSNKIALIRDHTNDTLSEFTGLLVDTYTEVSRMNDTCGYACSDHASWHAAGYPAVMPFEAPNSEMNRKIHTNTDLLENIDTTGEHQANFARIALAYLAEVSK